jgi:glycosyltransferase involved in cell wall biosynthesis
MPDLELRIGVVGARGICNMQGGIETYCASLYRRLNPELFSVTLYLSRSGLHPPLPANISVVRVPAPKIRTLETPIGALLAVLFAWVDGIRLLHVHGISSCLCIPLARALGMKIVVRHMGAEYRRSRWGFTARVVLEYSERLVAQFADTVICLSEEISRQFTASTGRLHGLCVIPNGVDPPPATSPEAVHQALGLEAGGYVLGVGRLVPEKEFATLIAGFLKADIAPRYKLVIVGGAAHSENHVRFLRGLAAGSDRIVFAGERFGADLWALYRNCALFVLPSMHEGMSFSLLEASSAGTMVLASDIEANATVCGEFGGLFPVGSAAALGEAITAAVARGRRQDEIDDQVQTCRSRYDWERIARTTEAVFLETFRRQRVPQAALAEAMQNVP